ncbi:hypothetical protein BJ741DRAFT_671613 [Chytriomyces cf. hyalinus JEL632]|nr:hypothetical protein BJ741DRAFT_671613 [Chytriomyces cf. hyalinus JEL632]
MTSPESMNQSILSVGDTVGDDLLAVFVVSVHVQSVWDLDEHRLIAALTRAQEDGVDTSQPQSKLLLFLYAKDILAEKEAKDPGSRKRKFDALLNGTSDVSVERRNRLKAMLEVGEKSD